MRRRTRRAAANLRRRRRRRRLRRQPPSPLDDDDLLSEILLRLPPQPSSLPRASAVCKRWHSLASDPAFSRRFWRHHRRNPPVLGFFVTDGRELRFEYTLEPPNRVPEGSVLCPINTGDRSFLLLGCRHGFLLMLCKSQGIVELLVWDPFNGHEHPVAIPPGFDERFQINGSVLRSALGDIQSFQVVLVSTDFKQRVIARVYSSETCAWGNLITIPLPPNDPRFSPCEIERSKPAVLIGDSLYMLLAGMTSRIIEFDVDRQSLAVIPLPVELGAEFNRCYSVMRAECGGIGLLSLPTSHSSVQLWKRKTDCDGVASWVLGRTIKLDNLESQALKNLWGIYIHGFAEENNVVFLWAFGNYFMVQLDSLEFRKLPAIDFPHWHPLEFAYVPGI